MDVTCKKCHRQLKYDPRDVPKRKTCPYPDCGHKFKIDPSSSTAPVSTSIRQNVQNVQSAIDPRNASSTDDGVALQDVQNVQNGRVEIADVQNVQVPKSPANQAPGTNSPSSSPSSVACNASRVQVAMHPKKKSWKVGQPPMDITTDDTKILVKLQNGNNQVQIAKALGCSASKISRRIRAFQDHNLVVVDSKTGKRVPNPVLFPKLAGKNKLPIATVTGTLPGGKYKIPTHNLYCYCEVKQLSANQTNYEKFRKTLPVLNPMNGWDRLFIPDKEFGFFGNKRFRDPNFTVISSTKGLYFYPTGWGDSYQEAVDDGKKGAEELHAELEKKYGLQLGFRFEEESKSKKRKPHPTLLYTGSPVPPQPAIDTITPSPAVTINGNTYQVAGGALIVNGKAYRPDQSHPDGLEGEGRADGQTLTAAKQDLESIPRLVNGAINTQLPQLIQDAVAKAFTQAGTAFASTIRDAVVAGIQQGIAQSQAPASQPQGKPPNGQYT